MLSPSRPSCDIIWISTRGKKIGLLRGMDATPIDPDTRAELIAISLGSATRNDLQNAYEENDDKEESFSATMNAMGRWLHASADCESEHFSAQSEEQYLEGSSRTRTHSHQDFLEWHELPYYSLRDDEDMVQFYNVLWIERKGNLAFRRAVGRVLKSAWDEHCLDPVDIILA